MVKNPVTNWEYSLETEAKRLVFSASQIANGFYFKNNFIVLPIVPKNCQASAVIFPKLDYLSIPKFWELAKSHSVDLPTPDSHPLLKPVKNLLEPKLPSPPNYQRVQSLWQQAQGKIFDAINNIFHFPTDNVVNSITIYPSFYGTTCSFNKVKTFPADITIYIRSPFNLYKIIEALLTSLTRHRICTQFKSRWIESELLIDWMLTNSKLKPIIAKYDSSTYYPTTKTARRQQQPRVQRKSLKYLQTLGINFEHNTLSFNQDQILANKKPITNLTTQEKTILKALIENRNQIIDFDQLGNLLFTHNDYSLYAISKAIQRLRNKLKQNNVPPNIIKTFRNQGYLLAN